MRDPPSSLPFLYPPHSSIVVILLQSRCRRTAILAPRFSMLAVAASFPSGHGQWRTACGCGYDGGRRIAQTAAAGMATTTDAKRGRRPVHGRAACGPCSHGGLRPARRGHEASEGWASDGLRLRATRGCSRDRSWLYGSKMVAGPQTTGTVQALGDATCDKQLGS